MNRIGVELFPYYLAVRLADVKAQSPYQRREKIENIVEIRHLYQADPKGEAGVRDAQTACGERTRIDGTGDEAGAELGAMLSELLEYVLDDPERKRKEILCKYVKENNLEKKSRKYREKREYSGCPFHRLERNRCRLLLKPTVKSLVTGKNNIQVNGTGGSHERI